MKRLMDLAVSLTGLVCASPLLLAVMVLIWFQDGHSPLYMAPRVGRGGADFRMIKLRSMVVHADASGVDSTGSADSRITSVGRFVRRYKLDEIAQLWNVLFGDMSLVGPRPNVRRETALYTQVERRLLEAKPGITDLASIVFADEGDVLKDQDDPDIAYNQLIRPWKSRLGLFYLDHATLWMDVRLCALTGVAILSRRRALAGVEHILRSANAEEDLITIARRRVPLTPAPPPGASDIVTSRT